jgi:hypothetical protein
MTALIDTLLAQAGFRRDQLTAVWILGAMVSLQIFLAVRRHADLLDTALYFAATSAFYYAGNAWVLVSRNRATERDWKHYQCLLGLMFFNVTLGFSAVTLLSFRGSSLPGPAVLFRIAGACLAAAGLFIKTWATLVVGIDCYYYKDLFFRRRVWSFSRRGPYAFLKSPMYGAGNLHLYGLALFQRSLPGLAAAALCHAAIFAFYQGVERPFVQTMLASES